MPLGVSTGAAWSPAKGGWVSTGTAWSKVKSVKRSDGAGGWTLAWVHPVTGATLSFSSASVQTGATFNVVATVPGGTPEGATAVFRQGTSSWTVTPATGATTVTLTGRSHATAGAYQWTVDFVTKGGTTTFGPATITVTQAHYHVTVPAGGDIQAAMDAASAWFVANKTIPVNFDNEQTMACVVLTSGATYTVSGSLHYRRGVRLVMTGATIKSSTSSNIFTNDDHGGGGYASPHRDWQIIGGTLDGSNLSGCISTVHTARFRVSGVTLRNIGAVKHHIEINSSGGARADGTYNCEVLSCVFEQTVKSAGARAEDEAIQLDYSWPGAAPGTANDGTMTNNVRIEGNTFRHLPRAIGGHHYQAEVGNASPKGLHSNILIKGNTFTDIDPTAGGWGDGANSLSSEGAVRLYAWSNVRVEGNTFSDCYQPLNLYIPADAVTANGNPTYAAFFTNTITGKTSTRPGIYGASGHASLKFSGVHFEGNIAEGSWGGTDYFVGCDDTTGTLPGSTYGSVIRANVFRPSNLDLAAEKAYNKYRAGNSTNTTGVFISGNLVSDGSVDNS